MADVRLQQQIGFLLEVDRLKEVVRRTYLVSGARRENSAEHSWHVALAALLFREHAVGDVDLARVVAMLLVHDLVEVDAGDTYIFDAAAMVGKGEREAAAAARLFALLPGDQGRQVRELWDEYEARATPDARYAAAIDRFLPMLHNYSTDGRSWQEHGIHADQVVAHNHVVADGAPALWDHAVALLEDAVAKGFLRPPR